MSAQDFDLELEGRLRAYAAAAAFDPTPGEIERAVVGASARGGARAALSRSRWLLVAALLIVGAAITVFVVGRLLERRTPMPANALTIAATGIDSGASSVWNPADGHWTQLLVFGRGPLSPDGRWAVDGDRRHSQVDYVLRGVLGRPDERRTIWTGLPLPDGDIVGPTVAWSPNSDWVARIHGDVVELAAVDPSVQPVVRSRPPQPVNAFAWGQAPGTIGRIATVGDGGVITILDLDAGTAATVTEPAFAGDFAMTYPRALAWAPGATTLAAVGSDGDLWLVDGLSAGEPAAHRLTVGRALPLDELWGWSADGTRIGVGASTFEATTGAEASVLHDVSHGCSSLPAWGPGGSLAFVADGRLATVGADGRESTVASSVCAKPETVRRAPLAWSPGGAWIAVPVAREGEGHWPAGVRVVVYEVATGEATEIVSDDRSGIDYTLAWRNEP